MTFTDPRDGIFFFLYSFIDKMTSDVIYSKEVNMIYSIRSLKLVVSMALVKAVIFLERRVELPALST